MLLEYCEAAFRNDPCLLTFDTLEKEYLATYPQHTVAIREVFIRHHTAVFAEELAAGSLGVRTAHCNPLAILQELHQIIGITKAD
jgi:predicted aminopeptidase